MWLLWKTWTPKCNALGKMGSLGAIIPALTSEPIPRVLLVHFQFYRFAEFPNSGTKGILTFSSQLVLFKPIKLKLRLPLWVLGKIGTPWRNYTNLSWRVCSGWVLVCFQFRQNMEIPDSKMVGILKFTNHFKNILTPLFGISATPMSFLVHFLPHLLVENWMKNSFPQNLKRFLCFIHQI